MARQTPISRYYCLKSIASPTFYNLCRYLKEQGWHPTRFNWRCHFGEKNLQFHSHAAEQLEFKHLLAQLVVRYCPQVMPVTYCINEQNWLSVLNRIANQYYIKEDRLYDQLDNLLWILKPALINNGQKIKIFQQLNQIEQHYLNQNRLGGEHVLQHYINRPHLLKGHKYSVRLFVIVTNYSGAYLYPQGYFNVALQPYQSHNFNDLSSHLTNEHLNNQEPNVIQIPTQRFDFFSLLYPKMQSIVTAVINGLQQLHPAAFDCKKRRTFAIFGFDSNNALTYARRFLLHSSLSFS